MVSENTNQPLQSYKHQVASIGDSAQVNPLLPPRHVETPHKMKKKGYWKAGLKGHEKVPTYQHFFQEVHRLTWPVYIYTQYI